MTLRLPARVFGQLLLEWFAANGRDLPWRHAKDPYHIWVSEVILQQTRVSQGMEYYFAFLERFPTIAALADAPLDAVMKCWQGLGYYTRARNLHAAAQLVVARYGGELPHTYEELLKLPGLGPYAAGAVASFAFGEPVPAIDGNVYRVLSRVFGVFDSPGTSTGKQVFRTLCMELLEKQRPQEFNQAMLDFGALQCVPGRPDCSVCPFLGKCYAEENSLQSALPTKERALKLRKRYLHYFVLRWEGSTFIELRQGKDIWHSLYQFPLVETEGRVDPETLLATKEARAIVGPDYRLLYVSEEKQQKLSHQDLFVRFYVVEPQTVSSSVTKQYEEVPRSALDDYQVPVMIDNFLAAEEAAEYFFDDKDKKGEDDKK